MLNFSYHNPVKIIFGNEITDKLAAEIRPNSKILFVFGGGSIKKNGAYDDVKSALDNYTVFEFSGIEPNPRYSTCMEAVKIVKNQDIDFILAVGGGSVLDAAKFIAAAARFEGEPWDILSKNADIKEALPIGTVLTLPATGSEMNYNSVISRKETGEKLAFGHPAVYPKFSILNPEYTFTLPKRQTANGVIDAFVHVMEQYMTYPVNAPLQDRLAEGILHTLVEYGPQVMERPDDYNLRATIMWTATMALNFLIGKGVPQDWSTHMIGHELTALHGIDHARTLAIILPAVWKHQRAEKRAKLAQYGRRIWNITESDDELAADLAIAKTEGFFKDMGMPIRLRDVELDVGDVEKAADNIDERGWTLGEHQNIDANAVRKILNLAR